jgi:teichuronic acid biosynthesis glycosyltransferase TuaH
LETRADLTIYHCVDFLREFEGVDSVAIDRAERELAATGVRAIASSKPLVEHLVSSGFDEVAIWENVAHVDVIRTAARHQRKRAKHVIFAGNLAAQKVDFRLLETILAVDSDIRITLVGPIGEGEARLPDTSGVTDDPRVILVPPMQTDELARLLGQCTVGLIPYRLTPYTRGVFPMKVYEYLSAGLAVVSTALPGLEPKSDIHIANDKDEFATLVLRHARIPTPLELHRRWELAREHSWAKRGQQARQFVQENLERRGSNSREGKDE